MNRNKPNSGISLLEMLVSMGILGLILLPVFFTFSSGNKNMLLTENEFRAHTAALEIMEQTISLPFKLIPVGRFSSEELAGKAANPALTIPYKLSGSADFRPTLEITEIKKNGRVRFKKISLSMHFQASKTDKREKQFTLKTLVANEENN
ncbi:MAG: hypothetical protein Kow0029_01440 [Candidatus Rifleibacteriota bacterium]